MNNEKVIDKIKKLQALVEGGVEGEALAAKRALDALCKKYDVDIEDLFTEKKEWREFKLPYNDKAARKLLFQLYGYVTNKTKFSYKKNRYGNIISFELTTREFVDLNNMLEFYLKEWKKELKQHCNDLFSAFINKNNLFANSIPDDDKEKKITPEEFERILRVSNLMSTMERKHYRKQIE